MKITILGSRGEVEEQATVHEKHSGVLFEDPLLMDIGEEEFLNLVEKEIIRRPEIFVTHFHPDHLYSIRTKEWSRLKNTKIQIYAPEIPEELQGKVTKLRKGVPVKFVRTQVTPIPTTHSKKVKSCALLVEKNGLKVLYTSDLIWINKRWHDRIRNCDFVITDGSTYDRKMIRRDKQTGEIYGHNSVPELVKLFKSLGAKRIVVTHFGKWFLSNPEEGKKKVEALGAIPAFDGMQIDLRPVKAERPFVVFGGRYVNFKDMHKLEALHMDDEAHRFVMQMHFRGKGAHTDHRWVRERHGHILDGMTIASMKPGITRTPVSTVSRAKELANNSTLWKLTNTPGPLRMYAEEKKPEPYEWLTYEGIVEPGEVGATREEYGVFYVYDRGLQFYGAQKPYFKEYFLQGKKMTGRFIYRLIERRKPPGTKSAFLWLAGKPIDQTPYVITRRALKDNWVPPWNVSCLPPEIRKQIPDKHHYWVHKDARKRLEVRNALLEALKHKEVTVSYEGVKLESDVVPYVLQHKYWKKRTLIRVGPSEEQFMLRIQDKRDSCLTFILEDNPLTEDTSVGKLTHEDASWMKRKGYIAPGQPGNPTADTPCWVVPLTQGRAVIVQSSQSFYKLQFLSGEMKGLFVAKQELGGTIWTLLKSELPEVK